MCVCEQQLAEVRNQSAAIADERDAAQKESRENATKVIGLTRQLEEMEEKLAESDRTRKSMQSELDTQLESKDDAGRHVHDLEKAKRALESQVEEQRNQMEELEDELQATEDAKLRLEVRSCLHTLAWSACILWSLSLKRSSQSDNEYSDPLFSSNSHPRLLHPDSSVCCNWDCF